MYHPSGNVQCRSVGLDTRHPNLDDSGSNPLCLLSQKQVFLEEYLAVEHASECRSHHWLPGLHCACIAMLHRFKEMATPSANCAENCDFAEVAVSDHKTKTTGEITFL